MTSFIRVALRKLGRIGLVVVLTLLAAILGCLMNFWLVDLFGFTYHLVEDIILVSLITLFVTPFLSWYLVGLLFHIDELEVKMSRLATIDSLTNTYNRGFFYQEGERLLKLSSKSKKVPESAVLILDLDDLKKINDELGHAGGDSILIAFGSILLDLVKAPNLVGRLGGDEFIIFLTDTNAIDLQGTIDKLLEAVRNKSVNIDGKEHSFTVSVGVSFIEGFDAEALVNAAKLADSALYDVKRLDRNGYAIHNTKAI